MHDRAFMPSHFARQFSYDQLYVGNPNAGLYFSGNLFEGAQAWYYSVAGGTKAVFSLLSRRPIVIPALVSAHGTSLLVRYLVLE